jgi:hypothetical protein
MGTEVEIVKTLAPWGVGGVLAYLMYLWYRKDALRWGEDHKERAEIMTQVVKENTSAITNNTAAVVHLADYLKNGRERS